MTPLRQLADVEATWCAAPMGGDGPRLEHRERDAVTPASVMKIQIGLAVVEAMAAGTLDGTRRVTLPTTGRTPGPVGMSLFDDPVETSVRDLLVPMLTISDNAATDALVDLVGLDTVNGLTARLGMADTRIVDTIGAMLDTLAVECGFDDYAHLVRHDPSVDGPPTEETVRARIAASAALDPSRGTRTTGADTVRLLTEIHGNPTAGRVRDLMARQLTRHRIASGFGPGWSVAAKSGGLLGVVRNEAGIVTSPNGTSYAVAIFTRRDPARPVDPARIDSAIGHLARALVDRLEER